MRGHNPVPPPSQDSVRPRRSLWSWLKFGRKSHREQDPVRPQEPVRPSLPEQPDRYVWSWPEFGHDGYRAGKRALIFIFDDIECSGQPPPDSWGGGPELAAEHSH